MGNGICPECGCELEETEYVYTAIAEEDGDIIEIIYECPCCDYKETAYDA